MKNSEKGSIGELMVTADLINKGLSVYKPVDNSSPFDLLVYHDNKYKRVQIKYRSSREDCITIELYKCTINGSKKSKVIRNSEVDILAIYCPETNKCYYINSSEFFKTINLRLSKPKNGQLKGIRFANDYLDLP